MSHLSLHFVTIRNSYHQSLILLLQLSSVLYMVYAVHNCVCVSVCVCAGVSITPSKCGVEKNVWWFVFCIILHFPRPAVSSQKRVLLCIIVVYGRPHETSLTKLQCGVSIDLAKTLKQTLRPFANLQLPSSANDCPLHCWIV